MQNAEVRPGEPDQQDRLAVCGKSLSCARNSPRRLKPPLILLHLRRGWKPRPFKASIESDFFRNQPHGLKPIVSILSYGAPEGAPFQSGS
jgi:hypothetical protein